MSNEKLLLELIKIRSESGNEKAIGDYICHRLGRSGFVLKKQAVNRATGNFNIYAGTGRPKVIFSNHIDTVPGWPGARRDKGKIFGRGACDNKSQAAAAIIAAEEALRAGLTDFGMLFTVQEETDFAGVKKAVDLVPECDLMVVGEPTSLKIIKGHNGILAIELEARGRSAHGSMPEKGINAIELLIGDLGRLKNADLGEDKILGKNILNIARISGGTADNIVPDRATALVAYRTTAGSGSLIKKIKPLVKSKIKILADFEPVINNIDGDLVKAVGRKVETVRYFTEGSILKQKAKSTIIIGAGNIREAHGPKEFVSAKEYNELVGIYSNIIEYYNRGKITAKTGGN